MVVLPVPDQPDYAVAIDRDGGRTRVAVTGEIDLATSEAFKATTREQLAAGPVLLDLTGLAFMDSSGVRALDALLRDCDRHGWELRIDPGLRPAVEQVLRLTGMFGTLPLERS